MLFFKQTNNCLLIQTKTPLPPTHFILKKYQNANTFLSIDLPSRFFNFVFHRFR
jgi:hypothetical protein